MLLRWLNKQRFDASWPASCRLPAKKRHSAESLLGHSGVGHSEETVIRMVA